MSIGVEGALDRVRRFAGLQDVQTGDTEFDAVAKLRGDPRLLIAALSDSVRELLGVWLPRGLVIEAGRVELSWREGVSLETLTAQIPELLQLFKWLGVRRSKVDKRLARNASGGRNAAAAVKALVLLEDTKSQQLLRSRRLLSEAHCGVIRLRYARWLGAETGGPTLLALVCAEHESGAIRAEAIAALEGAWEQPEFSAELLALGAIEVGALSKIAERAARALLTADSARLSACSEEILLLLVDDGPVALRVRALGELGRRGTEHALPKLLALSGALFGRGAVKEAALTARQQIVTRNQGVAVGGLSVVGESQRGGLSLSEQGEAAQRAARQIK